MDERDLPHDGPTTRPGDTEVEKERLVADAEASGADVTEALDLAADLAHTHPEPEALRAVDRRLATGYSVDESRDLLLGGRVTSVEDDER